MNKEEWEKQKEKRKQELKESATKTTDCADFKDWTSKDRTTAFFEVFGEYVKNPNKQDFMTVHRIWCWACHADKALAETIRYTLKWAGTSIGQEYKKWKDSEVIG